MGMSVKHAKPNLNQSQVAEMVKRLFSLTVSEMRSLPSYGDQNFYVAAVEGGDYILKIMNSEDSKNPTLIEVQTYAMAFLHQNGLPAPKAIPNTAGQPISMEEIDCGHGAQTYCVRLMTYVHGKTVAESPVTTQDVYHVGKLAATLDKTLEQLVSQNLDVLQSHDTPWSLSSIPLLEGYLSVMDGNPLQEVIKAVIEQYKLHVDPKISSFSKGIIHGDLSDQNIIVTPIANGHHKISGIIDFSLLMNGCYVFELAITIMYLMLENPNPLDVGGPLIAGWESIMPLSDDERDSLYLLVLGRLCQSLVYGQYYSRKYPDNKEYILTTARNGFQMLAKLWELGKEEVERKWFSDASTFSVNN